MTSRAPQFRPRRSKQTTDPRKRWIRLAIVGGAGVILLGVAAFLIFTAVSEDDDGVEASPGETPISRSTAGLAGGPEVISESVVEFVVQLEDVEPGYQVDPRETFVLTPDGFASATYFSTVSAGEAAVRDWGYIEGYQALLEPIGKSADVALGKHHIRSEVYRFATAEGASEFYGFLERLHTQRPGTVVVPTSPLANESSAYSLIDGTIPGTELPRAYHRFIARRGNLVYITQVVGVQQFTSIDQARDYAVIIDMKILGELPAPLPTPTPVNPGAGAAPTIPPTPTPEP